MANKLLLDENLRANSLWRAIHEHQATGEFPLDVVRIGDENCLPLGTEDPAIVRWAAEQSRVIVSLDITTLGSAVIEFVETGQSHPGLIFLRSKLSIPKIVELFVEIAHGSPASDWENTFRWLP